MNSQSGKGVGVSAAATGQVPGHLLPPLRACLLRCAIAVIVMAASWWTPTRVEANSGGITGYSGKQISICNACHFGGTAPLVRFEGPLQVAADTTATFRFVVHSQ